MNIELNSGLITLDPISSPLDEGFKRKEKRREKREAKWLRHGCEQASSHDSRRQDKTDGNHQDNCSNNGLLS